MEIPLHVMSPISPVSYQNVQIEATFQIAIKLAYVQIRSIDDEFHNNPRRHSASSCLGHGTKTFCWIATTVIFHVTHAYFDLQKALWE